MGEACSADGEERGVYRVLGGNLRERIHWGDPGIGGKIILRWIFRKLDVEWIQLAQDRDRWRGLVNAVINRWVPYNAGNFLTSCNPVSF
jgi:hypothetical protein